MDLWFSRDGWIRHEGSDFKVSLHDSPRFWEGMHPYIEKEFNNQLHGTITHYDALHKSSRTVKGFTKSPKGASTHFVIGRKGDLHQLISIKNRAWHAAFKHVNGECVEWREHGGRMPMANGHSTSNPNHWFVGIDLSNLGHLKFVDNHYVSSIGTKVPKELVFFDERGKPWEKYTEEAINTYKQLMVALVLELDMIPEMNYRHQDTSPSRKPDPGPALDFKKIIDEVYELSNAYMEWDYTYDLTRIGDRSKI